MALNINGTTGISGVDGSASAPALQGTDSNTGINFGTDTVNINTGGIARATVDSNGRLGVGVTSPANKLHVEDSASGVIVAKQTTNNGGFNTFEGKSSSGTTTFYASHNGRVGVSEGIIFGSDTASSNVLNDYEEGTFQPTVTNGATSVTYETNGRQGSYTKIGRFVFFTIMIHMATSTGNGNIILITGLPFTAKSFSHDNNAAGGADPFYQDAFYNANDFSGIITDGDTRIELVKRSDGTALTGNDVNRGREFRMTGTYMT